MRTLFALATCVALPLGVATIGLITQASAHQNEKMEATVSVVRGGKQFFLSKPGLKSSEMPGKLIYGEKYSISVKFPKQWFEIIIEEGPDMKPTTKKTITIQPGYDKFSKDFTVSTNKNYKWFSITIKPKDASKKSQSVTTISPIMDK